ncbi:MAG: hypothetical protein RI953_2585 [Pseudomonadota bacterium]|jgi:phosphoribosyl-ATP pyrophosphohydrolase/phosphoribosyl-AMP cyclohydrolase
MNQHEQDAQNKFHLEGAMPLPDWSKAVRFAPEQPPVLPMICQDVSTGQVLMQGYVSEAALGETLQTGEVVFWSRSRAQLWKKGETSGHVLKLQRVLIDCDGDALLALVKPLGPVCHRHSTTCFDAETKDGFAETDAGWSVVARLFETICQRAEGNDPESYSYKILNAGLDRVLRKLGEECTEAIIAGKNSTITGNADEFCSESADLLYHWLLALKALGKEPRDVFEVLKSREGGPRRGVVDKV